MGKAKSKALKQVLVAGLQQRQGIGGRRGGQGEGAGSEAELKPAL